MATAAPLMPKATAVWLLDNTALSFDQIAEFCKLHPLEVKAIADGVGTGSRPRSYPDRTTDARADRRCGEKPRSPSEADRAESLCSDLRAQQKGPRYTPVSRRQDRPNAILWLVRNHPELKDSAIMRLVGTTKSTIASIRDRTHWNSAI